MSFLKVIKKRSRVKCFVAVIYKFSYFMLKGIVNRHNVLFFWRGLAELRKGTLHTTFRALFCKI